MTWLVWDSINKQSNRRVFDVIALSKTICVKIGSSLLVDIDRKCLRHDWINALVVDICNLLEQHKQIIIVTSGAVATAYTQLPARDILTCRQALAAIGQPRLMMSFARAFDRYKIESAQILFNLHDTEDRQSHLDMRSTLEQLLSIGVVPIINENNTASNLSLQFGDNDRLSARISGMINADVLLMLSDIDGLYDSPPQNHKKARLIAELDSINPQIMSLAGRRGSRMSSGGMYTKLVAAKICLNSNCHMILANGRSVSPIKQLNQSGKATIFRARGIPVQAKKRWLAGMLTFFGSIIIDNGAAWALRQGNSLLAVGIKSVSGKFMRGDPIEIYDTNAHVIGTGISNYNAQEIDQICGKKSTDIISTLGYTRSNTVVHCSNLIIF